MNFYLANTLKNAKLRKIIINKVKNIDFYVKKLILTFLN